MASGQLQAAPGENADALTSTNATPGAQPALQWGVCHRIELESLPAAAGTGFNSRAVMWGEGRTEDRRLTSTSAVASTFTAQLATGSYLVGQLIFQETAEGGGGMIKRQGGMTGGMSTTMSGGMRG